MVDLSGLIFQESRYKRMTLDRISWVHGKKRLKYTVCEIFQNMIIHDEKRECSEFFLYSTQLHIPYFRAFLWEFSNLTDILKFFWFYLSFDPRSRIQTLQIALMILQTEYLVRFYNTKPGNSKFSDFISSEKHWKFLISSQNFDLR